MLSPRQRSRCKPCSAIDTFYSLGQVIFVMPVKLYFLDNGCYAIIYLYSPWLNMNYKLKNVDCYFVIGSTFSRVYYQTCSIQVH